MFFLIRLRFSLLCGLIARKISQLLKQGSGEQIQGRIVDALCPRALGYYAKKKKNIVISSTNGKTTTTRLIAQAIKCKDGEVITNALGANQRAGVLAAFINGAKTESKWAILEVDERSLPGMYDELSPTLLVFANLSRDQLDRFGEVASISTKWKNMLRHSNAYIIANGSDPHIVFATSEIDPNNVTYLYTQTTWHNDSYTCPMCTGLLNWKSDSIFCCTQCSFTVPDKTIQISPPEIQKISETIQIPGSWNITNATFAREVLHFCKIDDKSIFDSWKKVEEISGRNAIYTIPGNHDVQLFLAKNPAGWNEMLTHVSQNKDAGLIFAFNCNIADGKDPSWLYDVDFEILPHDQIVVFGERALDMTVRLDVAGKRVRIEKNIEDALSALPNKEITYLIASYTQFLALSRILPKLSAS